MIKDKNGKCFFLLKLEKEFWNLNKEDEEDYLIEVISDGIKSKGEDGADKVQLKSPEETSSSGLYY